MKNPPLKKSALYDEIHELVTACLLGQASPEEMARLEEIVRENDEAHDLYLEYIAETDILRTWSNQMDEEVWVDDIDPSAILELLDEVEEASKRDAVKKAAERTRKELEEAAGRRHGSKMERRRADRRPEPIVIPWSVVYATVGSIAAALVLLVYSYWPQAVPQQAETQRGPGAKHLPVRVATIIGSVDAQWSNPELPSSPGTRLSTGPLKLTGGVVEIRLDHGAKAIIQSPATLKLLSAKSVRLLQGSLVGKVPFGAIGFTVETPLTSIVDLGTEFGVVVDQPGTADVQVFAGKIEAVIQDSGRHVPLAKGRSVRVALVDGQTRIADVPIDPNRFVRQLPAIPTYEKVVRKAGPILYWRFEASADRSVVNEMGDFAHLKIRVTKANAMGEVGGTDLQHGAIVFDLNDLQPAVICDDTRDIPVSESYSIEFWMKPGQKHRGAIVSLESKNGSAKHTAQHGILVETCGPTSLIGGPNDPANRSGFLRFLHRDPPSANIRTGTSCYSRRPYAMGVWQHVVAVKTSTELRLYVNGQLSGRAHDSNVLPSGLRLQLGHISQTSSIRPFVGALDELAIYDRALSEEEIHRHSKLARPNSKPEGTSQP